MDQRSGRGGEQPSKPPPLPNPREPVGLHANPPPHAPSCITKGWGTQPQRQQSEAAREDLRRIEPRPIPIPHLATPSQLSAHPVPQPHPPPHAQGGEGSLCRRTAAHS